MSKIQLIRPSLEYAEDILNFRKEVLEAADEDCFAGCCNLEDYQTAEDWIEIVQNLEKEETCPKNRVTANIYIAVRVDDNKIVGVIDFRHHIDHPILSVWGGHIGYTVRPNERNKGYAKEMLRINLLYCKAFGLQKVLITCNEDNIASERTIIANGGVYDNTVCVDNVNIKRYWIDLEGRQC